MGVSERRLSHLDVGRSAEKGGVERGIGNYRRGEENASEILRSEGAR